MRTAQPRARARGTCASRPMKARRVVDLIRGLPADEALAVLQFAPQAASEPVDKVLDSAIANAEHNRATSTGRRWSSSEAYVDEGPTMKRFRPRAQGRAYRDPQAHQPHHRRGDVAASRAEAGRGRGDEAGRRGRPASGPEGQPARVPPRHHHRLQVAGGTPTSSTRTYVSEDVAIRRMMTKGMERAGIAQGRDRAHPRPGPGRHPHRASGHRHRPPRRRGRPHPRRPREAHRQAGPAEHPRGQEPRDRRPAGRPGRRRAARQPRVSFRRAMRKAHAVAR